MTGRWISGTGLAWFFSVVGLSLWVGACSDDGGDDDDGVGGTAGGTAGTGGTAGGGGCSCFTCGAFQADCSADGVCPDGDPAQLLCQASYPLLTALTDCLCTTADCGSVCEGTCPPYSGEDTQPDCRECKMGAAQGDCQAVQQACVADTTCPD